HLDHDARRPRAPGPRAQDGGEDARGRQGRALLREHRGRPRRRRHQRAAGAHVGADLRLPVEDARRARGTVMRPRRPLRAFLLAAFLLVPLLMTPSANASDLPVPPDAARKPHVVRTPFGAERQDEYYWLRDDERRDPAVIAYLE